MLEKHCEEELVKTFLVAWVAFLVCTAYWITAK
jgi:hypothetical protein